MAGIILFWAGCGSPDRDVEAEAFTTVNGNAIFGSQCPYGSLSKPQAAALNLWDCPLGLKTVDLAQPLRPIVLQADCKKKILVARTLDGTLDTSWEVLPNGEFSFSIDGGYATLKDDGKGNAGCSVPLVADLSGKLDCSDRDKVKISVETVWWLDRVAPQPSPNPSLAPSPRPSNPNNPVATPIPVPSNIPTHLPTRLPTITPTTLPTAPPTARPTPAPTPRPTRPLEFFLMTPTKAPTGPKCGVPKGCYFYASTEINQCE